MTAPGTEFYAGVGHRDLPLDLSPVLGDWANSMRKAGMWLRSGGAFGTDRSFENRSGNQKVIFKKYEAEGREDWHEVAEKFCDHWFNCDRHAKGLLARNVPIILGEDLKTPVRFVLCYLNPKRKWSGTTHALAIAEHFHIPIFNLYGNEYDRGLEWAKLMNMMRHSPYLKSHHARLERNL